jgi:thiol:disulfide interchange protein DsbC
VLRSDINQEDGNMAPRRPDRRAGRLDVRNWLLGSLFGCLLTAGTAAQADADKVKRELRARLPGVTIESVTPTPFAGLYEVVADGEIVYADETAEFFFSGSIYDLRTLPPRNLTEGNARRSVAGILARAAGEFAIRRVRGDGKRVLYTFEDPNCSFCKALHQELGRLDNVTIYTFPTPILSLNSAQKSVAAWCSADRAAAWDTLMSGGSLAPGAGECANPLEKVAALAKRLDISSTPVLYLGDGRRINGFVALERLEQALNSPE